MLIIFLNGNQINPVLDYFTTNNHRFVRDEPHDIDVSSNLIKDDISYGNTMNGSDDGTWFCVSKAEWADIIQDKFESGDSCLPRRSTLRASIGLLWA